MSYGKYQISTLGETFKLQYQHKKYWEIRYEQKKGSVIINCGKLLPDNKVDPDTFLSLTKKFTALVQIKDFINRHINIKISKGYKFLRDERSRAPTRKTSEEIITNDQSNLIKRPNPNLHDTSVSSLPGSEPTKSVHIDPFASFNSTSSLKTAADYSRSQESSFSASYPNKVSSGKINLATISKDMMKEESASSLKPPSMGQILEMSGSKKNYSSQIKDDEESLNQPKSPGNELETIDLKQKEEEFKKKVEALSPEECPFGKPTYGEHGRITTASKWDNEDPKGWYISEKLGGIRCLWNGLEMWSKNGTQYNIPDYFVEKLPKSPLDGELYMERGTLSKCMMIVKKKATDPDYNKEWNNMWFVVYDAPEAPGNFKQRLSLLKDYFGSRQETLYVRLHEQEICRGRDDAQRQLEKIEKEGGEGIVLREPNSPYTKGRSKFVLEKRSHFEAFADVIEHIKGKSKNGAEIVASLRVRTGDGKEFLINRGITDDIRQHPPAVGSQIVYKFSGELDSGKPKAPVFIKVVDQKSS